MSGQHSWIAHGMAEHEHEKCGRTCRVRLGAAAIHLMHAQARGQIHRVPTRTLAQSLECMEQKVAARPVDPPNELFRTQT